MQQSSGILRAVSTAIELVSMALAVTAYRCMTMVGMTGCVRGCAAFMRDTWGGTGASMCREGEGHTGLSVPSVWGCVSAVDSMAVGVVVWSEAWLSGKAELKGEWGM